MIRTKEQLKFEKTKTKEAFRYGMFYGYILGSSITFLFVVLVQILN